MASQPSNPVSEQPTALIPRNMEVVRAEDFMPLMTVEQAISRKTMLNQFISDVLKEGIDGDYGKIPGTAKPTLLKPGAEKLCSIFGLSPRYVSDETVEDFTGEHHGGEPFFYYRYRCQLYKGDRFLGEAIGSSNSWEEKHRWRWVKEADVPSTYSQDEMDDLPQRQGIVSEFSFAVDKAETSGPYGKPAEYWANWQRAIQDGEARHVQKTTSKGKKLDAWEMGGTLYRIPNPGAADCVNTCQKIGQKRALVAAVLVVTNCSDAFTQDVEDATDTTGIDTGGHPVGTAEAANHVKERKVQAAREQQPAEIPAELRKLVNDLPRKDGPDKLFDYIADEIKKTGDTAALKAHYARMEGWGAPFVEAGKAATLDSMQTQAIIEYGELEAARKRKAEAGKAAEESAFALG
jgi:hypothetical protein